jgi:hypothetical protein
LSCPGIVDEVVTLAELKADDGSSYRAFVTHTVNPYGFPAKDRSGRLDVLEPPHLGALIAKCASSALHVHGSVAAQNTIPNPRSNRNDRQCYGMTSMTPTPQQSGFDLIPKGTVVPVRMTMKPGGYDDPEAKAGRGGYATRILRHWLRSTSLPSLLSPTVSYAKRKMWSEHRVVLSKKGPTWGQMGRSFIRAALNSARNIHPQDNSHRRPPPRAASTGFHELDGHRIHRSR